jgi:hypothetical protein
MGVDNTFITLPLFPKVTSMFGIPQRPMPRLPLLGRHVTVNQAEVFILICKMDSAPRREALHPLVW